jgi:ATP-dependent RNA helicase DDX27
MELKKGQNLIEHEEEIYSRPARTWFQSGQEKLKAEGVSLSVQRPLLFH